MEPYNATLTDNKLQSAQESVPKKAGNDLASKSTSTKVSPATLVEAIKSSDAVLFHDQYHEDYIAYDGSGSKVSKIATKSSKLWLAGYGYSGFKSVLTPDTINRVLQTLAAHAHFDGKQHSLEVRTVRNEDGLWYDLGASAVRVTADGWDITDRPPIIFKRFSHQKAQVMPVRGGNIQTLLKYINISDEAEQLLFLVYVVAAYIPNFPHPLLILHGAQGAGKTTPMRLIKELADPSVLSGLSTPKNIEAFVQTASHHSFLFYDNLSKMPEWFSDALARAATGDSFSKRELYSDDEDIIYRFQKTIALNGINQVVYKSDLLDRSILLNLERITPKKRMEAQVFWAKFEADQPAILGAIFDTLAAALYIYPTVRLSKLPRMADFTRWGYAIAEAAGYGGEAFIRAYDANIAVQHDEAIEANPVAKTVIEFMRDYGEWHGTPSDLYADLTDIAYTMGLSQSQGWPKDAARLGKALTPIVPNLTARGIDLERSRDKERMITIRKSTVGTDCGDEIEINSTDNSRQYDGSDSKNPRLNNEI